jgi:hypothetical protein
LQAQHRNKALRDRSARGSQLSILEGCDDPAQGREHVVQVSGLGNKGRARMTVSLARRTTRPAAKHFFTRSKPRAPGVSPGVRSNAPVMDAFRTHDDARCLLELPIGRERHPVVFERLVEQGGGNIQGLRPHRQIKTLFIDFPSGRASLMQRRNTGCPVKRRSHQPNQAPSPQIRPRTCSRKATKSAPALMRRISLSPASRAKGEGMRDSTRPGRCDITTTSVPR